MTNKQILIWENLDMAKKKYLKRETESLLIRVQNNTIMIYYVEESIDKTQQNNRYRFCGNRDKTINHIISKCSKLVLRE